METARDVHAPETEMSSHYAEQVDFAQTENQQDLTVDKAARELKTMRYNLILQNDANNIDTDLNSKEAEGRTLQIYEDKNTHCDEANTILECDRMCKEVEVGVTMKKVAIDKISKKVPARRSKKNNQLLMDDKKESLKKTSNCGKVAKQKTTRKSNRISLVTSNLNKFCRQLDKELKQNCTKLELYKIETGGYVKKMLEHALAESKDTNNIFDTNIPCCEVTKQQELNQYSLDNNRNALQYLDYNNMRCMSQQAMSINSNPWLTAPKNDQNFTLNSNATNTHDEMRQSGFVNDRQYHMYATADYNWRQKENPYSNSSINSTELYKLFPSENRAYSPCNVYDMNCIRNNMYPGMDGFPNATFQQAANNIGSNYVTSTAASNSFLNTAARPLNPFYNYQPLQTDCNFKKLYYTSLNTVNYGNNSGCEMMSMMKENVMPPANNWYHMNPLTTSSNSLNVPLNATITSWSDTLSPSYSLNMSSTNTQLSDHCNKDTMKMDASKDQYRERGNFSPYVGSTFEDTLPAIDTHGLDSYRTDGLTNTLVYQNSTAITTDNNTSDMTNLPSETKSADVPEEFTCCTSTKKKDVILDSLDPAYQN